MFAANYGVLSRFPAGTSPDLLCPLFSQLGIAWELEQCESSALVIHVLTLLLSILIML